VLSQFLDEVIVVFPERYLQIPLGLPFGNSCKNLVVSRRASIGTVPLSERESRTPGVHWPSRVVDSQSDVQLSDTPWMLGLEPLDNIDEWSARPNWRELVRIAYQDKPANRVHVQSMQERSQ
jgi:hypothetical protein